MSKRVKDTSALDRLSPEKQKLALLMELERRGRTEGLIHLYPEQGPLCRQNYPKHLQFFKAGRRYRERAFVAANRSGKSYGTGGYETALHLTGAYPDWWEGRRFSRPVRAVAAGDTGQTVRDIVQQILIGPPGELGTGLIPKAAIVGHKKKPGNVPDAVESVVVKHLPTGGRSRLQFKSFDQGRRAFQGVEYEVVWMDEECPLDVWNEAVMRTMTTDGMCMLTFTPLMGLSDLVLTFMPEGKFNDENSGKFVIGATWDDVPHLGPKEKEELWKSTPPHLRDARSKGIPHLGAGAIYPVPEGWYVVDPIEIPPYWPRAYGMDVGWNRTSVIWGALDRESDCWYIYSEHTVGEDKPPMHAAAILARGKWIPGVIDPSARGRAQQDGEELFNEYCNLGLDISPANNAVEAGIYEVWTRLTTDRLKVFNTCRSLLGNLRIYRRDEKGKPVKQNDHECDALRYLMMSGKDVAVNAYAAQQEDEDNERRQYEMERSYTNLVGGYG